MVVEAPLSVQSKRLRLGDLKLLEVNARFMRHETYAALVANIARDGVLTQSPFAVWDDDAYLVLSGNHRVKAAIDALGPDHWDNVLVSDEPLNDQQRLAIQLSHNAIVGEDDPATLKRLYEEIEDVDWRAYTGLDDATLDLMAKVDMTPLSEANLDFQPISLVFLPSEAEFAQQVWDEAKALIPNDAWLASMKQYDEALDALELTSKSFGVSNVATALLLVLQVFRRHVGDLRDGYLDSEGEATKHKTRVPIETLLESRDVPPSVASVVNRAIERMIGRGEVKSRVEALEVLAAEYLAGQ